MSSDPFNDSIAGGANGGASGYAEGNHYSGYDISNNFYGVGNDAWGNSFGTANFGTGFAPQVYFF